MFRTSSQLYVFAESSGNHFISTVKRSVCFFLSDWIDACNYAVDCYMDINFFLFGSGLFTIFIINRREVENKFMNNIF